MACNNAVHSAVQLEKSQTKSMHVTLDEAAHQISLVQQNTVCIRYLRNCLIDSKRIVLLFGFIQVTLYILGINQSNETIQPNVVNHLVYGCEGEDDWSRICQACCLDHNVVELISALNLQ